MINGFLRFLLIMTLPGAVWGGNFQIGGETGFNSGVSVKTNVLFRNIAKDFPFMLRAGVGYTALNPGNSAEARRIFINNATNGTPEKRGWLWDMRLDFLYPVKWFSLKRGYFYAGPRFSKFTGNFNYVGGNENFDVTSNAWGFGGGLESHFPMTKRFDFILSAGLDYYATRRLQGHDTSYSPDGETINGREDYTYENADNAINQPKLTPHISLGINFFFK
ncbi:MAG: hypothetical protein KDI06_04535 [Calditrichaeota bacterium]|nr:hypothetical protein [Calditrichota bacterium]